MDPSVSSDSIESTPPPAVSSLRSRFEQLAAADSVSAAAQKRTSTVGLSSLVPASPRPRANSGFDDPKPDSRTLRPASSSSDLKVGAKRPPPPPPPRSRAPSPAPPIISSPLLRPVLAADPPSSPLGRETALPPDRPPVSPTKKTAAASLLARKPPPPPPPLLTAHVQEPKADLTVSPLNSSVSSLIHQFGNGHPSTPPLGPKPLQGPNRVTSHTVTSVSNISVTEPTEPARRPRHSYPASGGYSASSSSSSLASASSDSSDPFGDTSSCSDGTVAAGPPPLPVRRSGIFETNGHDEWSEYAVYQSTASESSDSRTSSESDVSQANIPSPSIQHPSTPRPAVPPPRPPPRHKAYTPVSAPATPVPPPPLPVRKATAPAAATQVEEPHRRSPLRVNDSGLLPPLSHPGTPVDGRKMFGHHPPPPTRTIGLGDKLPPARRQASSSSSEDEDEDVKKVELLPDTTRSSRRPPTVDCYNYSEFNIHVPAYTSAVAVSGHTVAVVHGHHLKVYDLSIAESPIWNIDSKGLDRHNGIKLTALEFRPSLNMADRGAFLWFGTKDGTLIEFDVRTGEFGASKPAAHSHPVTHMFRHGRSMVTMDDSGKVLVFSPEHESADDVHLTYTQPRVVRIADKQDFVRLLGGQLWTSARETNGGGTVVSTSRGPMVRVYDIFSPGSTGRSLLPTEHLGAVTSGTILPSHPDHVYLGHEGGHISIWSLTGKDNLPVCEEVVRVSSSDVLSLEGVNNRLWAGGRIGMITAYDVSQKPWIVTNSWQGHTKLPVLRLAVDTWSIEKLGRLTVYSIGRDERLRFWDGLLGTEWVDLELHKRESEYSTFRDINVLIISWNMDAARPDGLNGCPENVNFLHDALTSVEDPDIIVFGFQELIDLESRKMAAKTVLLGGKNKSSDGAISQKVTTAYKKWHDRVCLAVRMAMPSDVPYTVVHHENLVGLLSVIFVKNTERISLKQVAINTVKRGMGGRYGNKGGIIARFVIDDTSLCFINCHLAAGQHHVRQRNADAAAMVEDKYLFPESDAIEEPLAYVNGGDGSMVLDHEIIFMNGDMNYRIDQRRDAVVAALKAGELESLLVHDQLLKEMKFNRGFRLRSFTEGPLTFAPTYKYDRRSSEYDTSEKARVPAWCDRVLWRSRVPERVQQLHYRRYEANVSDHRPVSAAFRATVKSVQHEARARIKAEVLVAWRHEEQSLLKAAHRFFIDQAMI